MFTSSICDNINQSTIDVFRIPTGYVYVLFESEKSVKALLQNCTHDFSSGGEYYYKITSRRMRCTEVHVQVSFDYFLFFNNNFILHRK